MTRDEDRDIVLDSFGGKIPATLQDLFPAYDAFKTKGGPEGTVMQQLLQDSFQSSPDTVDSERCVAGWAAVWGGDEATTMGAG